MKVRVDIKVVSEYAVVTNDEADEESMFERIKDMLSTGDLSLDKLKKREKVKFVAYPATMQDIASLKEV